MEWTSYAAELGETSGEGEEAHIVPQQMDVFALVDTSGHWGQIVLMVGMYYSKRKKERAMDRRQLI